MKKSNSYKATVVLGISFFGLLLSYPFKDSFTGGFFTSLCSAAMVGGIADWFGVTALFRKPLGISFRTEIIPRNREKIFNEMANMVQNEFLTKERLKSKVEEYDIADLLIRYLKEHGGKQDMKEVLDKVVQNLLDEIHPQEMGVFIEKLIKDGVEKAQVSPIVVKVIAWSIEHGYDDLIIDFTCKELIRIIKRKEVHDELTMFIKRVRSEYEKHSVVRTLTDKILLDWFLSLSPANIAQLLQDKGCNLLEDKHVLRKEIRIYIENWLKKLKEDKNTQDKIEKLKVEIVKKISIHEQLAQVIKTYKEVAATHSEGVFYLIKDINQEVNNLITRFEDNVERRNQLNSKVQQKVIQWIDKEHGYIGKMVNESLNHFTNAMLIEFIESKVGNDLQMIRINGSIVGGLVGAFIFVITFWFV
ncbi:uncharacterized membrane-anchored protein YjiN (DUF445 family) [Aneurinibacillus soli]|uniref:Uncharacterized protein n=1 Tax=Aneurinibacillus soli TaxID=1500254 RepID=A0A0U5B8L9_9BACL|nr:DUF445 domain-containing protein [Aneurinibacillus soli]PYE62539.1 uncharacterized membrane-anchored protein YjiN (DUF445 family) [Aneurinibacillus soli]BAU27101.1 hypothetical protein CB4_01270 [Aneurinibacillus soli]